MARFRLCALQYLEDLRSLTCPGLPSDLVPATLSFPALQASSLGRYQPSQAKAISSMPSLCRASGKWCWTVERREPTTCSSLVTRIPGLVAQPGKLGIRAQRRLLLKGVRDEASVCFSSILDPFSVTGGEQGASVSGVVLVCLACWWPSLG